MKNHVIVVITQTVNVNVMNREDKARLYDEYIRESDILQRENSKIKSEHVFNVPQNMQVILDRNNARLDVLVKSLERLYID
jgi:hypothetical protein